MTDAKYRIYMRRIGYNEILKEEEYENGGAQDAQTVANVLDCPIYVELEGIRKIVVSASIYVDPIRGQ